ncbi:hypothetical protein [Microbulbifer epialgicus]|uniref:Uncharacterized protein n=1 Tax=Microbulbifer epialgicus TaxID=393907 RepID=A0ABV4NUJ8_9GAMM
MKKTLFQVFYLVISFFFACAAMAEDSLNISGEVIKRIKIYKFGADSSPEEFIVYLNSPQNNQLGCSREKILFKGDYVVENYRALTLAHRSNREIKIFLQNPGDSEKCFVISRVKF